MALTPDRESFSPPRPGAMTGSLAMLMIGVGTKLRELLDGGLNDHGITLRHLGALGHLASSPELSTSDLARRANVTPQSMRATVDHLEALGAVEHRRHGQGKASELLVTDHGHDLLDRARALVAAIDAELLGDIENPDRLRDALMATMLELRNRQHRGDLG